ncbi:MAG TPA: hypothetical protein DCY35_05380 [Prolixibacteraceae bacterium]|nr:hypothetical protein [Prolixibacteraceae bacterium]
MKPTQIAIAFLLVTIICVSFSQTAIAQVDTSDIRTHLNGPSTLGTLRSGTYSVTFIDPESRTWSYEVYVTAKNTTGAFPLKNSPANGTISPGNNTFTFDVTAQQDPGELEIHINYTAGVLNFEKIQKINVVYPISLRIKISNPSNVEINNATVQFFVDGIEIDKQVVAIIPANQAVDVESEWISFDKESGWHDSRIVVDINNDGIIDTHSGDIIVDDRFYIEGDDSWLFGVIVAIGVIILIFGFGYISRQKMK